MKASNTAFAISNLRLLPGPKRKNPSIFLRQKTTCDFPSFLYLSSLIIPFLDEGIVLKGHSRNMDETLNAL